MKADVGRSAALILALAALAAAGCGGSNKTGAPASTAPTTTAVTTVPQTRPLTALDLVNIIGSTPDTPEGADYAADSRTATLTLADLPKGTSEERATVRQFRQAGFKRIYQRSFNGAFNVADATAYLFGSAAGGAKAFSILENTLQKPGGVNQRVTPVPAKGLGDQSWAAHVTGGVEGAVFLWQRGSLVVVADMSCDASCGLDIVGAVRTYATEIDARAAQTP
jgi:hypothetical protein